MPIPLFPIIGSLFAGWSIRAYADHKTAVDAEASEGSVTDPITGETVITTTPDSLATNADSVWDSITNTDGLF